MNAVPEATLVADILRDVADYLEHAADDEDPLVDDAEQMLLPDTTTRVGFRPARVQQKLSRRQGVTEEDAEVAVERALERIPAHHAVRYEQECGSR